MSNYLTDVAARSLESTEVLQPRLASRFESVLPGGILNPEPVEMSPDEGKGSLAEEPWELESPARSRETALPTSNRSEKLSLAPRPTRLPRANLETAAAHVGDAPFARNRDLKTVIATPNQPESHLNRPHQSSLKDKDPENVERLAISSVPVALSIQPPGDENILVSQFETTNQPLMHPTSILDELGVDRRLKRSVGESTVLQPAGQELDGTVHGEHNAVEPAPGRLINFDHHDLDSHIRSALGDILAYRPSGDSPRDPEPSHSSADEAVTPRPVTASDRAAPAHKETAHDNQPAVRPRVTAQPQIVIAPPARPASPDRAAISKLNLEPAAPPTVQVTIGRIEVRATPAPSTVATSKPTRAPVMSLEEYLRNRNRGGA